MSKPFEFLGKTFRPIGNLASRDFHIITRHCRSIGISTYHGGKWNYDEFYRLAKEAGAENIDVFSLDSKMTVIPCENELFAFSGQYERLPNFKKPFIVTVHLLFEAGDQTEAQTLVAESLTSNLMDSNAIKDWAYAKRSNGELGKPEKIEGLNLSGYEKGTVFEKFFL